VSAKRRLTAEEIEADFLARVAARDSLEAWIEYRQAGYKPAAHHKLILRELEAVERGDVTRLMLLFPPGSAKSSYASVEFPPWFLGRNPSSNVIAASHTLDLAERFGRKARNIVGARDFTNVFEVGLSPDSAAASKWETTKGGEYFAVGVGGSVTGRRADLGLIDDPVKSREAADSERERETAWQWYLNDFLTRLKPGARQILIMTRWHEDDLGGRILDRDGDKWRIVKVPMECDSPDDPLGRQIGERLWAEWFTEEMIADAKKDSRVWNALYQQNPIPEEGNFFKADWFIEYRESELPSTLHVYGASDFAVTEGKGDFTEHGIFGVDFDGNIWIIDWWFGRTAPDRWIDEMATLVNKHKPLTWFAEAGPIRRSVEPFMLQRLNERRAHVHLEWLASIHDKATRARSIQALASMGKIKIPKDRPWISHCLTQWLQFPSGKYDDAVDALAMVGRGLEFVRKASSWRIDLLKYRDLALP
jgi:predicted phage terminase large subunit-like protein